MYWHHCFRSNSRDFKKFFYFLKKFLTSDCKVSGNFELGVSRFWWFEVEGIYIKIPFSETKKCRRHNCRYNLVYRWCSLDLEISHIFLHWFDEVSVFSEKTGKSKRRFLCFIEKQSNGKIFKTHMSSHHTIKIHLFKFIKLSFFLILRNGKDAFLHVCNYQCYSEKVFFILILGP